MARRARASSARFWRWAICAVKLGASFARLDKLKHVPRGVSFSLPIRRQPDLGLQATKGDEARPAMSLALTYCTARVTPVCALTPPIVTVSGTLGPGVTPAGTWALIWSAPEIKPGAAPT